VNEDKVIDTTDHKNQKDTEDRPFADASGRIGIL